MLDLRIETGGVSELSTPLDRRATTPRVGSRAQRPSRTIRHELRGSEVMERAVYVRDLRAPRAAEKRETDIGVAPGWRVPGAQIGRASCRERGWGPARGRGIRIEGG